MKIENCILENESLLAGELARRVEYRSQTRRASSPAKRSCVAFSLCVLLLLLACAGCREDTQKSADSNEAIDTAVSSQYNDDMFLYAIDRLNNLEEYTSPDALRQIIERLDPNRKPEKTDALADPALSIWPEPETLHQVVDRLNQWARAQQPPADWKLDPMLVGLPKPLGELPAVKNLAAVEFSQFDGFELQEAVWLRDIGRWARGNTLDDLDRARSLFDWTVRNIQLDADGSDRIPQFPWETLLLGHGTASERAWAFILLLRQIDIDAAMLAVDGGREKDDAKNAAQPWCVGVLIEGNVYLFDPRLGLPIPAADGLSLDDAGQLAIRPATLAQAAADEKILQRLDADERHKYRVKASDLNRVTVLLEASPTYLARRMKLLESRLAGTRKMVLTTSAEASAKRWKAAKHVADARLWTLPYETLERRSHLDAAAARTWIPQVLPLFVTYDERVSDRAKTSRDPMEYEQAAGGPSGTRVVVHAAPLYRGRVLYLKGKFSGDDGATRCFQIARPSNESLQKSSADAGEKQVKLWAKLDASYWSGSLAYQQGNYPSAVDYFMTRTLEAFPNSPWTSGARYNLARSYEAQGEAERAILHYSSNAASPDYHGELLRAKWLKEAGERKAEKK